MSNTNDPKFQQTLARLMSRLKGDVRDRVAVAIGRGLKSAADKVCSDAQILAPIGGGIYSPRDPEPGRLRDSAKVTEPVITEEKVETRVSFNTVYAAVQHERLDFRHDQGQAKYLETAVAANLDEIPKLVKAEIHEELRKK